MNAVDMLEEQHRETEDLFSHIEDCDDESEKQALFEELADSLAIHASLEEAHFYPTVRLAQTEDLVLESLDEHSAIKHLTAELLRMGVLDERFDERLQLLREQVEHHVAEEESELFPRVRKLLGEEQLQQLAQDMVVLQDELDAGRPREVMQGELTPPPF